MKRAVILAALAVLGGPILGAAQGGARPAPESGTQAEPAFAYERRVATVRPDPQRRSAQPQRLAIDQDLLIHSAPFRLFRRGEAVFAEQGLADLRFVTEDGQPVPYLLIHPATGEPKWIDGRVLSVAATKKTSGFEVDLGDAVSVDMIRVEGLPAPFLKRLTLEASGDRARWTMLVDEGTLFDLPDERIRQDALAFPAGDYRYFRLTWNDTNSGRVPEPRAVRARRVAAVPAPKPATIEATLERRPSEPGVSRYRLRLPAAALPIVAVDLEVGQDHVYRRAAVTESRFAGIEAAPIELGTATLARVTRDGVTASNLRVPIAAPSEAEIDLTIDDGDNAPLDVRRASVVLAQLPWIYLEAPAGLDSGVLVARYGNATLQRPAYDLEALRESIDVGKLRDAAWSGDSTRVERTAAAPPPSRLPDEGPAIDPAGFRHARPVHPATTGLVALPLDAHVLAFSRGPAGRFADVRVLDASNRQIPYLLERRNEPLSLDLSFKATADSTASQLKAPGSRLQSIYALTLPHADLPPATLVIETSARVFQRTVQLGIDRPADRQRRTAWFDVQAAETWRHADEGTPARPLTLRLQPVGAEGGLRLVIDEGDNRPLPIGAVRLLLPSYRLRFYHPAGAALRLVYGRDDLQAPQYDLALLAPRVMGAAAQEASAAVASTTAPASAESFVSPRTFWIVLSGAVLVLLALIVRLVRSQTDAAG